MAALVALTFGALLWWTETGLRSRLTDMAAEDLSRQGRLVSALIGDGAFSDSLADELGRLAGARVTLISPDGTVRGDSEVPAARIPSVENHAARPEVRAALEGRVGTSRRASATVARSFLYAAIPHSRGVVRVARAPGEVEEAVARARGLLLVGGALTLLAAAGVAWLAADVGSRPLRRIRDAVAAIRDGDLSRRIRISGGGAVGELADAVDEMADAAQGLVEHLRAEKDDLNVLFDTLEDGLAVLDRGGTVVEANRAFQDRVGRPDVIGRRFATLVRAAPLVEAVEEGLGGSSAAREGRLGDRTVYMTVQPHRSGALVVLRDLTKLRRLEGVRRDFVANVSHELKTPLTGIVGFAEAIADGELSPDQTRAFGERILANARRMRQLADNLLDLARIESGRWEPLVESVDLAQEARSVWSSLRPTSSDRRVDLAYVEAGLPRVRADPEAVRQILRNLFDNALRYAPEGTEVGLRAETEDGMVRIAVSDTGPGIPSVHASRVFERFYRVDAARSREEGGTGLGLSIVKHLVDAHGGDVGIESEVGRGTTVWFTLPAA